MCFVIVYVYIIIVFGGNAKYNDYNAIVTDNNGIAISGIWIFILIWNTNPTLLIISMFYPIRFPTYEKSVGIAKNQIKWKKLQLICQDL